MAHIGSLKNRLIKLWESGLDYVFPKKCFGCGREGEYLCSACFDKIEYIQKFPCFICNQGEHDTGVCPPCAAETAIDRIIVATTYSHNVVGALVEALKYNYIDELARVLARILQRQIKNKQLATCFFNQVLSPIPLHRKRLAERGFNQALLLAKALAMPYNCQIETALFSRVKYTAQQAKLSRNDRLENMRDAITFNLNRVAPAEVILLDDVLTTGATFAEAALAAKRAGVKKIICVAVCHG